MSQSLRELYPPRTSVFIDIDHPDLNDVQWTNLPGRVIPLNEYPANVEPQETVVVVRSDLNEKKVYEISNPDRIRLRD